MAPIVQQPYNLFAQQKMAGYPTYGQNQQQEQQTVLPPNGTNQGNGNIKVTDNVPKQSATETGGGVRNTKPIPIDSSSSTAGMEYLNSLYTSPEEEERLRKSSVANQRILAVGDALRHIANIAGTVNYAVPQKFNSPVQEEYARYERGKALRDAANARYYSYQQQKANQEARMKQLSDAADLKMNQLKFQQEKFNRQQSLNEFKAKNDDWYKRATIGQKEQALEIQRQLAEGRISLMEAQTELNKVKTAQGGFAPRKGSSGGRGGGGKGMDEYTTTTETTYNYDNLGKKTGSTTTKRRTVNGKQKTKKANPMGGSSNGKKKNPMS